MTWSSYIRRGPKRTIEWYLSHENRQEVKAKS